MRSDRTYFRSTATLVAGMAATAMLMYCLPGTALARQQNLAEWVEKELSAYVANELTAHPRFKGASVRFVVMRNGSPLSNVDELSLRLRDRLQRQVVGTPGVTIAWQPNGREAQRRVPQTGDDCSADAVQYLIGIELRATGADAAQVSARALDVVEKTWVSGFGKEWQGRLSREQQRALQRRVPDRTFLGDRGVPYTEKEADLMAAHLAHDLRCELMRVVSGEYVVDRLESSGANGGTGNVLDLVAKNIAGVSSLQFAVDDGPHNALLQGQAHVVDADLHQYWVTITPADANSELQAISTSVYVRIPTRYMSASPAPAGAESISVQSGALLDSLRMVRLESNRVCPSRNAAYARNPSLDRRGGCLGLEVTTNRDAVVFVLNHQQNNGLVRLDDGRCSYRTAARISRANEAITVALPTSLLRDAWLPENEWQLEPDADTYYAIAVSDSRAARALSAHLDELPQRCSESVRAGYEGRELAAWLTTLSSTVAKLQPFVDWNAIRIKNIY